VATLNFKYGILASYTRTTIANRQKALIMGDFHPIGSMTQEHDGDLALARALDASLNGSTTTTDTSEYSNCPQNKDRLHAL
jgi:hypothetical protein